MHIAGAGGGERVQFTHDGHSLNPVWGRTAIAFDHERLHANAAPAYEVWEMNAAGGERRQVTHLRFGPLLNGLVPIAFSADGSRLLAELEGQDTSQAWLVSPASDRAWPLQIGRRSVSASAIAHDGVHGLVDLGGFLNTPSQGAVASLPILGAAPRVLVAHGSEPSWNS